MKVDHNPSTLYHLKKEQTLPQVHTKSTKCCVFNVHALGDVEKTDAISDFVSSHDIDIVALTETWLKGDPSDAQRIGEISPPGYSFSYKPRGHRKGGGVGILTRKSIKIKLLTTPKVTSFEYIDCDISSGKLQLRFVVIYHPPPSKKNKSTTNLFLEEFTTHLERLLAHPGHLIIVDNFNLHIDVPSDPSTIKFNDIINSLGLAQHVTGATHQAGHTLDLVITPVTQLSSMT